MFIEPTGKPSSSLRGRLSRRFVHDSRAAISGAVGGFCGTVFSTSSFHARAVSLALRLFPRRMTMLTNQSHLRDNLVHSLRGAAVLRTTCLSGQRLRF